METMTLLMFMKTTNICDRHLQWDTIILESTSSLSQMLCEKKVDVKRL